jgi:hypothetical protein
MTNAVVIGGRSFGSKAAAEAHIRELLDRWKGHATIKGDDADFVNALLAAHPQRGVIADCGIKHVRVQEIDNGYLRFLAVRVDGSVRDFSWRHCISPKSQRAAVMSVCRSIVDPQIAAFRGEFWSVRTAAHCPVANTEMTISTSDVDHAPPNTFAILVEKWLAVMRSGFELIEIEHQSGYGQRSRFVETWLEPDWAEYHEWNARLRVVSRLANRSLLRRKNSDEHF